MRGNGNAWGGPTCDMGRRRAGWDKKKPKSVIQTLFGLMISSIPVLDRQVPNPSESLYIPPVRPEDPFQSTGLAPWRPVQQAQGNIQHR
jgi:hypothetical protein